MNRWKELGRSLLHPLAAIVIGLAAGALAIVVVGESVTATYRELWNGAFGNFFYTTNTLARMTPILLIALGVTLAFRTGFFNLGAEGQMVLGAVAAALTALYVPGPGAVKLAAAIAAGVAAGGVWSAFAGWMDARYKLNLLITTLLFNYIAVLFASYLVSKPFMDTSGSAALAQTPMLDPSAWLPKLFKGMSLHIGFIFAIVAAVLLYLFLQRTKTGYEVRMLGLNPSFAEFGGIRRNRTMLIAMLASGGLAGLAGTVEVLGMQYRYVDGALTIPGYAWTGLMAALLAESHPIGAIFASLLLAALQTGAMGVERNTSVPLEISSVIQAVLILFVTAKFSYRFIKRKKGGAADGTHL